MPFPHMYDTKLWFGLLFKLNKCNIMDIFLFLFLGSRENKGQNFSLYLLETAGDQ